MESMEIMWYFWLFVVSFLGVRVATWIYRWSNPECKGKLPPGSMGLPIIGETLGFFAPSSSIEVHPFVKERMERYGPLFKTSIAGRPVVLSLDPDFNYFLLQQEDKLVEMYYMDSFSDLIHNDKMNNLGGFMHKYLRRAILKHFGQEALKQKLLSRFEVAVNHELHEWSKQSEVDIMHQISPMLFDLATKIMMSCEVENLGHDMIKIMDGLMAFPIYFPGTAFYDGKKKQQKGLKLMNQLIEERRKSHSEGCRKGDFLDEIVEDMDKEAFLTKEFVPCLVFGLLFAIVETLSLTFTTAAKYLLENPSLLQQLTEENEEILKNKEDASSGLSWEEYKNSMTFTRYVINESLRIGNILPGMLRRAITDIHVDGYTIPKGWIILIAPTSIHLDPNLYEDPLRFNPSRWKDIGSIAKAKNFIPFGGGNRPCAGAEYSKVLLAVFLHVWVTKYRLTKIKGGDMVRAPILEFRNGFHVKVSEKHI